MATTYSKPLPPGMTADELDTMFGAAKAKADAAWQDYMNSHVPADLQPYLADYQAAYAPPAGAASVVNGQAVRVVLAAGGDAPGSPGHAAVVASTLNFVQLS